MLKFQEIINEAQFSKWREKSYKIIPLISRVNLASFKVKDFYESLPDQDKVLLESNKTTEENFYSIICLRPRDFFFVKNNKVLNKKGTYDSNNHINELKKLIDNWSGPKVDSILDLPLYSGLVGFFSYEASRYFDSIKLSQKKERSLFWDYGFWFYDEVYIFNHKEKSLYLCSSDSSYDKAQKKMQGLKSYLFAFEKYQKKKEIIGSSSHLRSNFEFQDYLASIEKAKSYIKKGHSYQINMAQKLSCKTSISSWNLYRKLIEINPVSYGAFLKIGDFSIICGSPEKLIKKKGSILSTRPIAGTRKRGETLEEDLFFKEELKTDSKEKAEHAMLVDLMRNDLGKISQESSVAIASYAEITDYTHVMHLESDVISKVKDDVHPLDIFAAVFPGGTITGVPKRRTMEIIDELEPSTRDIYTGAIGYISASKDLEFNIVIRSMLHHDSKIDFHVGGGLTYDCLGKREYKETLNKSRSQLLALGINHELI